MTILESFKLPGSANELGSLLAPHVDPGSTFFLAFMASKDATTGQAWCPDVRVAQPHIENAFSGDEAPLLAIVEIEQDKWCELNNDWRTTWKIHKIPTLVRYKHVGGEVVEAERLVEGDILDQGKREAFLACMDEGEEPCILQKFDYQSS